MEKRLRRLIREMLLEDAYKWRSKKTINGGPLVPYIEVWHPELDHWLRIVGPGGAGITIYHEHVPQLIKELKKLKGKNFDLDDLVYGKGKKEK